MPKPSLDYTNLELLLYYGFFMTSVFSSLVPSHLLHLLLICLPNWEIPFLQSTKMEVGWSLLADSKCSTNNNSNTMIIL